MRGLEKFHRLDAAKEKRAAPESSLIGRVRTALSVRADFQEKRMYAGVTFMARDQMCTSAAKAASCAALIQTSTSLRSNVMAAGWRS